MAADGNTAARLTRLDFLRGVAASAVILFHYHTLFARPGAEVAGPAAMPLKAWLWPLYDHGNLAVPFFWLLSGMVFYQAYGGRPADLKTFFWRRFARLYPLHFATLLVMVALNTISLSAFGYPVGVNDSVFSFLKQIFLATHWFDANHRSFNYPIWSVSMEVIAYAVFYVFLRYCRRTWCELICFAVVFTTSALWLANYQLTCIALFFIGCIVIRAASSIRQEAANLLLICSVVSCVIVYVSPFHKHLALAVQYWLFPAALLLVAKGDLQRKPIGFTWLGECSYSIYLIHVPMLTATSMLIASTGYNPATHSWFLVFFVALVFCIARVSYSRFEMPARNYIANSVF